MLDRIQVVALAGSVLLLLLVLELVRRRRLAEEYSALWIVSAILLIGLSLRRDLVDFAARWLGVYYPPAILVLMLVGIVFVAVALLLGDSVASTATDQPADRGERHHGGRIARSSPRPRPTRGQAVVRSFVADRPRQRRAGLGGSPGCRGAQRPRGQAVNRRAPSPRTQDSGS